MNEPAPAKPKAAPNRVAQAQAQLRPTAVLVVLFLIAAAVAGAVRDAWLRRIGELLAEGKADDAKASLAEFRRRYPEATLPPELRTLEP